MVLQSLVNVYHYIMGSNSVRCYLPAPPAPAVLFFSAVHGTAESRNALKCEKTAVSLTPEVQEEQTLKYANSFTQTQFSSWFPPSSSSHPPASQAPSVETSKPPVPA